MNVAEKTLEELLQEIGRLVGDSLGQDYNGAFLYAETKQGVVSAAIFKDLGDHVLAVFPSDKLSNALFEAWDLAEQDKKWASLSYTISGQQFDARFEYPAAFSLGEDYDDRLARVLAERYGGKTVRYPQLDLDE